MERRDAHSFLVHSGRLLSALLAVSAGIWCHSAVAQEDPAAKERAAERHRLERARERDSLAVRTDTLAAPADTLARLRIPLLRPTLDPSLHETDVMTRAQLDWTLNRSMSMLLRVRPGFSVRDLHSQGQYNQLWASGVDDRGISILENGRSAVNPATGLPALDRFPTEMIERLETVTGPRSFLYGWNGVGGALNVITKARDTNIPLSHIGYSEGPDDIQQVSGSFAQNVARGINLSLDFDHSATAGRYTSSLNDTWVAMAMLRVAVARGMTATLSERYTSARTDLNGGVNAAITPPADVFVPLRAAVVNPDAYEKSARHDFDLSFAGMFLKDSSDVTRLTLYYSRAIREFRDEENRSSPNGVFTQDDHRSHWMGLSLSQSLTLGAHQLLAGASLELREVEQSPTIGHRKRPVAAVWLKHETAPLPSVRSAVFGRMDRGMGSTSGGAGADVSFSPARWLRLTVGGSLAQRLPTFTEMFWNDSTVTRTEPLTPETHHLLEVRVELTPGQSSRLGMRAFRRSVSAPVVFFPGSQRGGFPGFHVTNGAQLVTQGLELSAAARFWLLELEGMAAWQERPRGDAAMREVLPRLTGHAGLYLSGTFLDGQLPIRAGGRFRWQTSFRGERLNPAVLAFVPNEGPAIGEWAVLDAEARARIGDAVLFFLWENLTDIRAYAAPYYPVGERAIWFGLSWEFLN